MMRNRGLVLWCVAAIQLGGCGQAKGDEANSNEGRSDAITVTTAAVEVTTIPATLALDGTLLADEDSQLTSVVPGRVMAVLVERGQRVEQGQLLVRLRDVDLRLQARAARAQLEQAEARLGASAGQAEAVNPESMSEVRAAETDRSLAESNLRRGEELAGRGVLSAQALEQLRAQASAARERYQATLNNARAGVAALEGARASAAVASTAAGETLLRAPFAGEIAERFVSVGEYVSPQTPVVTLVRTDPLRLQLSVPQQRFGAIREGQVVHVTTDARPGQEYAGSVAYLSSAANPSTRTISVEVLVPNAARELLPGMFATANLELGDNVQVSKVPRTAVLERAGVHRLFTVSDDAAHEQIVTVLRREGDIVYLEGDLGQSARVAVSPIDQLSDGAPVVAAE